MPTARDVLPFILPDRTLIERAAGAEFSNALYNYYGWGPLAAAKCRRFRRALAIGSSVAADGVIDMGCAEGVLVPTLAKAYRRVVAIDQSDELIVRTQSLIRALRLDNVQAICNKAVTCDQIRQRIGTGYQLMFLLETLEHVGRQPDIWGSKIEFLHECFSLLQAGGQMVISVPKMVGPIVLVKNLLQLVSGRWRDPLTPRQLLRSAFLNDTEELEPLWHDGHVGFNHLKLDECLKEAFSIRLRVESMISVFYLLARR